jgi:UDP-glucose 4-epimerase
MPAGARVLVTGGAGFIGSHLCEELVASGNEVLALDDLSTGRESNLARLAGGARFRFARGSAADAALVEKYCAWATHVVHLAAAVGVSHVLRRGARVLAENHAADELVLEHASRAGLAALYASSSEVYGPRAELPLREDVHLAPFARVGVPVGARVGDGRAAYAAAKRAGEERALSLHRERGLRVVVARLFNTVGPRQRPDFGMVLPRFARQAVRGEPLTVYGDGAQTRSFAHVAGVARALAALIDEPRAAGAVVNVGAAREVAVAELARMVLAASGSQAGISRVPLERALGPGAEEPLRRVPDTARLLELVGWQVPDELERAVAEVVAEQRAELHMG